MEREKLLQETKRICKECKWLSGWQISTIDQKIRIIKENVPIIAEVDEIIKNGEKIDDSGVRFLIEIVKQTKDAEEKLRDIYNEYEQR